MYNIHKGNGEGVDAGEFALFYISDITSFVTKCISSDCTLSILNLDFLNCKLWIKEWYLLHRILRIKRSS